MCISKTKGVARRQEGGCLLAWLRINPVSLLFFRLRLSINCYIAENKVRRSTLIEPLVRCCQLSCTTGFDDNEGTKTRMTLCRGCVTAGWKNSLPCDMVTYIKRIQTFGRNNSSTRGLLLYCRDPSTKIFHSSFATLQCR
jgi:hypothetical protein